jgi:hypothetical protein
MEKTEKKQFLLKSLAQIVFITGPAIILSGYLVYKLRPVISEWGGIEISDFAYSMVLMLVMVSVMYLTSKNIFRVILGRRSQGGR